MKEIIGDFGLKGRYSTPENFIGIHKLVAAMIILSLIATVLLFAAFIGQKQDESFKRFIKAEKAGVFQGVTLAPLRWEGQWQIEIAGASGEGKILDKREVKN